MRILCTVRLASQSSTFVARRAVHGDHTVNVCAGTRVWRTLPPLSLVSVPASSLAQCPALTFLPSSSSPSSCTAFTTYGAAGSAGALREARRYQRSPSSRVRSSSWKDKTQRYTRLQEEQMEAEEAAQRRARAASSAAGTPTARTRAGRLSSSSLQSSFWRPKRKHGMPGNDKDESDGDTSERLSSSRGSGDRAAAPRQGLWSFLRGGDKGRFRAPLNPLGALKKPDNDPSLRHDADARSTQRLLHVVDELRMRSKKTKNESVTAQLSDEQRKEITNRYAETRWYGNLYRPFRDVTEKQIKWTRRLSLGGCFVLGFVLFGCCFYVYYEEIKTIMALSEEDRSDYLYMVNGMRYSDIFFFAQDVLKTEDPLNALPPAARYHVVIEACRKRGWHTMDWEVEQRKMHPKSAFVDMDLAHLFYWCSMYAGSLVTGGGGVFSSDRLDELLHIRARAREKDMNGMFIEAGPEAPPQNSRRGFF